MEENSRLEGTIIVYSKEGNHDQSSGAIYPYIYYKGVPAASEAL